MRLFRFANIRFVAVAIILCIVIPSEAAGDVCSRDHPLPLNSTVQLTGSDLGTPFALEIPSPGWLAVEVAVPGLETIIPWIDIQRVLCAGKDASKSQVVTVVRSATRQLLEVVTPGVFHVRVGVMEVDPYLTQFKLSTRFLEHRDHVYQSNASTKEGEDDGDDTEESVNEILPLLVDPGTPADSSSFCPPGEPANDLTFCATRLLSDLGLKGKLGDGMESDHDYFTLTLSHPYTIHVFTSGASDTYGVLYDEHGRRLMAADDGGVDENFVITTALSSGRYFIRIEGASGLKGDYIIHLSRLGQYDREMNCCL